ncbi:MAG: hypothetical protein HQK49_11035 [Oligoflexia bacterium]|nr:hypothetical protein [Oligoflexia bacterium]
MMKTVTKINPDQEYENAKKIIEEASKNQLCQSRIIALNASVDNLITVARVLMEREDNRRGKQKPPKENPKAKGRKKGEDRAETKKLPSERYPNLEIKESILCPDHPPKCPCCGEEMKESGLFDTSEKLEVIPKKYVRDQKGLVDNNKRCTFNNELKAFFAAITDDLYRELAMFQFFISGDAEIRFRHKQALSY